MITPDSGDVLIGGWNGQEGRLRIREVFPVKFVPLAWCATLNAGVLRVLCEVPDDDLGLAIVDIETRTRRSKREVIRMPHGGLNLMQAIGATPDGDAFLARYKGDSWMVMVLK